MIGFTLDNTQGQSEQGCPNQLSEIVSWSFPAFRDAQLISVILNSYYLGQAQSERFWGVFASYSPLRLSNIKTGLRFMATVYDLT